jgi:hypothetical protein
VGEPIRICFNRRLAFAAATLFGVGVVIGTKRGVEHDDVLAVVISLVVFGPPFALYAFRALRRRIALVVDDRTITITRSHQVIPWDTIFEAQLIEHQGNFGLSHELVLTVQGNDKSQDDDSLRTSIVDVQKAWVSLDQLSMPSGDIVALVQGRLGKNIPTRREAGLFRKSAA